MPKVSKTYSTNAAGQTGSCGERGETETLVGIFGESQAERHNRSVFRGGRARLSPERSKETSSNERKNVFYHGSYLFKIQTGCVCVCVCLLS